MQDLKNFANFITNKIIEYISEIEPNILKESSLHLIISGGKRLRPYLLMKIAEIYGCKFEDSIYAGIAVELIHNFSLVHDDIMDNDEFRHGKPTVHVVYGIPFAILAGDTLFSLAFNALNRLNIDIERKLELFKELSIATLKLSIGQAYDMYLSSSKEMSEALYYKTVENKTASLFECSAVMGAILGGAERDEIENIRKAIRYAGIAFQIKDDILGVFGDPKITGKPVGNDIREGKKTLIIIYAYEIFKEDIFNFLGNKNVKEEEMIKFIEKLKNNNIHERTLKEAKKYEEKALYYASKLPHNLKEFIQSFISFLVEREY